MFNMRVICCTVTKCTAFTPGRDTMGSFLAQSNSESKCRRASDSPIHLRSAAFATYRRTDATRGGQQPIVDFVGQHETPVKATQTLVRPPDRGLGDAACGTMEEGLRNRWHQPAENGNVLDGIATPPAPSSEDGYETSTVYEGSKVLIGHHITIFLCQFVYYRLFAPRSSLL